MHSIDFICSKPPSSEIDTNITTIRLAILDDIPDFLENPVQTLSTNGECVRIFFGTRFDSTEKNQLSELFSKSYFHVKYNAWTTAYHKDILMYEVQNILQQDDIVRVLDLSVEELHCFDRNKKCTTYFLFQTRFKTRCFYRTDSIRNFKMDLQLITQHSNIVGKVAYLSPNLRITNDYLYNEIKNKLGH